MTTQLKLAYEACTILKFLSITKENGITKETLGELNNYLDKISEPISKAILVNKVMNEKYSSIFIRAMLKRRDKIREESLLLTNSNVLKLQRKLISINNLVKELVLEKDLVLGNVCLGRLKLSKIFSDGFGKITIEEVSKVMILQLLNVDFDMNKKTSKYLISKYELIDRLNFDFKGNNVFDSLDLSLDRLGGMDLESEETILSEDTYDKLTSLLLSTYGKIESHMDINKVYHEYHSNISGEAYENSFLKSEIALSKLEALESYNVYVDAIILNLITAFGYKDVEFD